MPDAPLNAAANAPQAAQLQRNGQRHVHGVGRLAPGAVAVAFVEPVGMETVRLEDEGMRMTDMPKLAQYFRVRRARKERLGGGPSQFWVERCDIPPRIRLEVSCAVATTCRTYLGE